MAPRLHVVNGSHPCAAVLRALELKGIDVRISEYLPPLHPLLLSARRVGSTRVPVLVLESGEAVPGSRRIFQRLDAIQPDPLLYPREQAAAIEAADRWGEEVLQSAARTILWGAFAAHPVALSSFQAGSRLPRVPRWMLRLTGPLVVRAEHRLNDVTPEAVERTAAALPAMLRELRVHLEAGAFGDQSPTAADLQIGSSLQLLRAVQDLRPLVDEDPVARDIARWLPPTAGSVPSGALPADLVERAMADLRAGEPVDGAAPPTSPAG